VLHLVNESHVPGEVRGSDDPKVLRWKSPAFAEPLDLPLGAVRAVHYEAMAPPPAPRDEYGFELTGDDVIYGDLLALTDDHLDLNSTRLGRIRLRREAVRRFYRLKEADAVYAGPTGLTGWKDPAEKPQWREEGGEILTDRQGATLFADLNLPDKAAIEIEISWRQKPDFTLALGVAERDFAVRHAFRFEVWDGQLVVVGESARDADAAVVEPAGALGGRIRVLAYFDQQQRRLILVSQSGKLLATLKIEGNKPPQQTGVRLTNFKGDVRLETLRVARWNGVPPQDVRDDQSRVHRTDGSIVYGQLAAFDPETKRFTIRAAGADTVIPHEAIADIVLAPVRARAGAAAPAADRTFRIVYRDGSRVSGEVTRIEDGHVGLTCPGVEEHLRLPLAGARSLISLRPAAAPSTPVAAGRPGRLETDGLSLRGRLADGGADGLNWQPDLALNASPLAAGLSGRVVYREPPAPPPPAPNPRTAGGQRGGWAPAGVVFLNGMAATPAAPTAPTAPPPPSSGRRSMHLRTGDTIPCEVTRIDEQGVTFKTPNSDSTFVAHEKIKSVELIPTRDAPGLDEAKRDRLLTLPRMQKESPPTHLICSTTGDFLRGCIVEMDDARLKVEVRLEVKEVPRDRVAQIIWLHADELADEKAAAPPANSPRDTRAQTVDAGGNRLTFVVGKFDGKNLSGTSEVLGACRTDLADVDELLFGSAIEQSVAKLAYHDWKLHYAPEPKFAKDDAGGADGLTGTESPLVGQLAPPFQLEALDGSKFKLADRKGRVVVLDFWATWCGPCMQSMPVVEDVIREFADRDVELLAVNMEEQPEQVKAIMERHKFKAPVAIDRDGAVAAKYAVTAIPQTVVIDREGKVARLFVGGGKATADALRKSLQELSAK
jgi:peroxiredoxin